MNHISVWLTSWSEVQVELCFADALHSDTKHLYEGPFKSEASDVFVAQYIILQRTDPAALGSEHGVTVTLNTESMLTGSAFAPPFPFIPANTLLLTPVQYTEFNLINRYESKLLINGHKHSYSGLRPGFGKVHNCWNASTCCSWYNGICIYEYKQHVLLITKNTFGWVVNITNSWINSWICRLSKKRDRRLPPPVSWIVFRGKVVLGGNSISSSGSLQRTNQPPNFIRRVWQ